MEEDNKMLRLFMKPTPGDSNAKAELRAQQMRQTKRKEIREGLRTKLREYAPQLNNTNEPPRDIWIETLGVNLTEETKGNHEESHPEYRRSVLETPRDNTPALFK